MIFGMLLALVLLAQAQPNPVSQSALMHRSAMRGETEVVEMLIKLGADVNILDEDGKTPLHDACLKGQVNTARLLLDRGAKIDARDKEGASPLHDAALGGNVKIIEFLLERKADADARDAKGLTPLDYAVKMERAEAVRVLKVASDKVKK